MSSPEADSVGMSPQRRREALRTPGLEGGQRWPPSLHRWILQESVFGFAFADVLSREPHRSGGRSFPVARAKCTRRIAPRMKQTIYDSNEVIVRLIARFPGLNSDPGPSFE
jgi:hypothetical protein